MEKYVEFYFPGRLIVGENEKKVDDFNANSVKSNLPNYAIAFCFFEKDNAGNKVNFSNRYWIGNELSVKDLKVKYPQVDANEFAGCEKVVKTLTGVFYPLNQTDVVI